MFLWWVWRGQLRQQLANADLARKSRRTCGSPQQKCVESVALQAGQAIGHSFGCQECRFWENCKRMHRHCKIGCYKSKNFALALQCLRIHRSEIHT